MKIGDEIKIGGVWWKIKFVRDLISPTTESLTKGYTDLDGCEMYLESSLPDDVIDEVFWHEILHIVLDKSGYRPGTDLKHDHTFIESATPTLHQIMDQVMEWNERELEPVDEVEEADPMADYFRSKEIHLECGGEWEYLPNMVKKCRRCGHEERWVYS